jgi:hypothetical protein
MIFNFKIAWKYINTKGRYCNTTQGKKDLKKNGKKKKTVKMNVIREENKVHYYPNNELVLLADYYILGI